MNSNKKTTEVIDTILLVGLSGSVVTTSLLLPGSIIAFGPIMERYYKGYDKRQKEREYQRLISYMKRQNLLKSEPRAGNGLVLTDKGRKRAVKANLFTLSIDTDHEWDGRWRMVIFDIPEKCKTQRDLLSTHLKTLGLYQLQKSVWIHPYDVREEIAAIAVEYNIDSYITLVEVTSVDRHKELKEHFKNIL